MQFLHLAASLHPHLNPLYETPILIDAAVGDRGLLFIITGKHLPTQWDFNKLYSFYRPASENARHLLCGLDAGVSVTFHHQSNMWLPNCRRAVKLLGGHPASWFLVELLRY
jgi:hypothetical protein